MNAIWRCIKIVADEWPVVLGVFVAVAIFLVLMSR